MNRRAVLFGAASVGCGAALGLTGCDKGAELEPLGMDALILAFGDSLTFGTGARPDQSYPAQLAQLTGREVVNAGVPGEVSADGLRRLPRLLSAHRPALVIVCHGGNDILRRLSRDQLAANLSAMVASVRAAGAQAVLVGVPDFGLFVSTADLYGEVASATGAAFEGDAVADILGDNALKADNVHPNSKGYAAMAAAIDKLLRARGAL